MVDWTPDEDVGGTRTRGDDGDDEMIRSFDYNDSMVDDDDDDDDGNGYWGPKPMEGLALARTLSSLIMSVVPSSCIISAPWSGVLASIT